MVKEDSLYLSMFISTVPNVPWRSKAIVTTSQLCCSINSEWNDCKTCGSVVLCPVHQPGKQMGLRLLSYTVWACARYAFGTRFL